MKEVSNSPRLIGCCGLYCGACSSYLGGSCPGCSNADKKNKGWCKVRHCCHKQDYSTCADCAVYDDPKKCVDFNSFISIVLGFLINSDRRACILRIHEIGREDFATEMTVKQRQSIPRRGKKD
jgi:hypothetical protein